MSFAFGHTRPGIVGTKLPPHPGLKTPCVVYRNEIILIPLHPVNMITYHNHLTLRQEGRGVCQGKVEIDALLSFCITENITNRHSCLGYVLTRRPVPLGCQFGTYSNKVHFRLGIECTWNVVYLMNLLVCTLVVSDHACWIRQPALSRVQIECIIHLH